MTISVGDRAPNFTGVAVRDGVVRDFALQDAIGDGPVVLAFFPFTFSGSCTQEVCDVRDAHAELAGLDARVFAVSIDAYFNHRAFAEVHDLPFTMVSDGRREGIEAFGVAYDEFLGVTGVAKRSVFVIDGEGIVRYAWVTDDADVLPDIKDVQRVVADLARVPAAAE